MTKVTKETIQEEFPGILRFSWCDLVCHVTNKISMDVPQQRRGRETRAEGGIIKNSPRSRVGLPSSAHAWGFLADAAGYETGRRALVELAHLQRLGRFLEDFARCARRLAGTLEIPRL